MNKEIQAWSQTFEPHCDFFPVFSSKAGFQSTNCDSVTFNLPFPGITLKRYELDLPEHFVLNLFFFYIV